MTLKRLLRQTRAILLDFDGPVTQLLPPGPNMRLANRLRAVLADGGVYLPDEVQATSDHLSVLRFAARTQSHELLQAVEDASVQGEIEAAAVSLPTPGAHQALLAFQESGRPVVVVSNNATPAVWTYLERFNLTDLVRGIEGRPYARPLLMKPHPELVERALNLLRASPQQALLIGDSVTDIEVCKLVGVPSVGFAKTRERGRQLAQAGANTVVETMTSLPEAVRLLGEGAPTESS